MGKGQTFQQIVLVKLDIHSKRGNLYPCLISHTKTNSKETKDIKRTLHTRMGMIKDRNGKEQK